MGVTIKENVSDIRNSRVRDIVGELTSYGVHVEVYDPRALPGMVQQEFGFALINAPSGSYDAIIVAVAHDEFKNLEEDYFRSLAMPEAILVDVKGIYRGKIHWMEYWSL
jgi:UDP-N-acetyl-D-galactosamine dehydrogenase